MSLPSSPEEEALSSPEEQEHPSIRPMSPDSATLELQLQQHLACIIYFVLCYCGYADSEFLRIADFAGITSACVAKVEN